MKEVNVKVYSFNELSEKAQSVAINNRINDMLLYEITDHYENWPEFKNAIDKADKVLTPWFYSSYIYEHCGNDIIQALKEDGEIYLECGEFAPIPTD